ncbi:MAG: MBL fold metallo-hydrolase [Myxococcales bacterium]|nr:MBL fold metallo-hydrolase [Myxococcales bacterium]
MTRGLGGWPRCFERPRSRRGRARPASLALLAVGLLPWGVPCFAQPDTEVRITRFEVVEGLDMLVGRGGNLSVLSGEDGILLVDDQFAPLTSKIRAAIAEIQEGPVRFVLNTHWHGDHTGGNENFARAGALLFAQDAVRERMSQDQEMRAFGRTIPASPEAALPVVTFSDSMSFHLNGEEIHVHHAPRAHTDGDAIVHFRRANAIATGDIYFNGSYPFIDLASGGSVEGMIIAVERVLALSDEKTRIVPGHGPLSNRAELRAYRDMLVTVRGRVTAALREGTSLAALSASQALQDLDGRWGRNMVSSKDFLRSVYASLSGS